MATEQQADVAGVHRYKLKPPTYNGDIAHYEEWKYKFQACMGLQHNDHDKLMRSTDNATTTITELDLETAASSQAEADRWKQLSPEMKYILTSVTSGGAATICRQYQHETGYEILRQLNRRYSIPVGTRSMGYVTKVVKPTLDPNNFEESFASWEYELTRVERDNSTTLPDQVKIAILLNEATGPLQQHLQLLAGTNQTYAALRTTITEYYRATTAFSRMQASQAPSSAVGTNYSGGSAPMDIGPIGKSKGHKGKGYNRGKGYGYKGKASKGHGKGAKGVHKGYNRGKGYGYKGKAGKGYGKRAKGVHKGKYKSQGSAVGGTQGTGKGKGWQQRHHQAQQAHKGKGKGKQKSKDAINVCYKCGMEGHYAKDCRVAVYNLYDASAYQPDLTAQWYTDSGQAYATDWWHEDHTGAAPQASAAQQQGIQHVQHIIQQQPAQQRQSVSGLLIAMTAYTDSVGDIRQQHDIVDLMIDSGAATHVCPQRLSPRFQLHELPKKDEPPLRTVTNTQIKVHGYKYVIMKNNKGQPIVIPFYVCDVHAPLLSVTRLTEQGFNIQLNETPTITHKHGFETQLAQKDGLYFMRAEMTQLLQGTTHTMKHTEQGQIGMIARQQ